MRKLIVWLVVLIVLPLAAEEPPAGRRLRLLTPSEWQQSLAPSEKEPPKARVPWIRSNPKDGVLGGADLVSYLEERRPATGKQQFELKHRGVTFRFLNEAHRKKFAKDAEAYLPQFGGYCAYAMAKGRAVPASTSAWRVLSGRLYFFASEAIARTWERDAHLLIPAAAGYWPQLHR